MEELKASFRVCRRMLVTAALLVSAASGAAAATWLTVAGGAGVLPAGGTGVWPVIAEAALARAPRVLVDFCDDSGLEVTVDLVGLEFALEKTAGGQFVRVRWPEASPAGEIGKPLLPVVRRLFIVPPGATVDLEVEKGQATVIDLAAAGFADPIIPMQAPIEMVPGALERASFRYDDAAYAVDEALPAERVAVTELGIVRGHRLHLLEVRPAAYNAARGTLTVWPHIGVSLSFRTAGTEPGRHIGGQGNGGLGSLPPLKGLLLNPPGGSGRNGRGSGNYLIVVSDNHASTIAPFATAKTAQGFNVTTHSVAAGTSATVIKAYIESLWGTPDAPDYILLVGEGNEIPCWWGGGDKRAGTDLPYACMDGGDDWYPDIAIGRFSVRTTSDLQNAIDKTLYIEAGVFPDPAFLKRAVFMCGMDSETGDEATHNWVINTYLLNDGFTCDKNYMRSQGATTQDVRDSFNAGCLYGMYYGHAWSDAWQDGPRFLQSDVQGLSSGSLCVFLVHLTCTMGTYMYYDECFTEAWLRVQNKGAAVNIGASSYIYYENNPGWPEISDLEKFVFDSVYVDQLDEVSAIWQAALLRLLAAWGPTHPPVRDYFEMFNLMGDPSLRLPAPPGFELTADPASQSICCPPETETTYTVDVQPTEGFPDPVTLSASGNPPASTVSFSVNSVPPPFTSVMTVSSIIPGLSGEYNIEITGSAPGIQRSTFVDLYVSDSVPGQVTLTSPPDGATDVSRKPTLVWQPASQAVEYYLQVATDANFANVVYSAIEADTSHTMGIQLESATLHCWHVRGRNACGNGDFSPAFSFTTIDQMDYFTEQFIDDFDLANFSVEFIPDGSDDYYESCGWSSSGLPTDPSTGTTISLGDDRYEQIWVAESRTVRLYNLSYTNFYVGSNGYITFGGGDTTFEETLAAHFDMPRISALFDDLNPQGGGRVSWEQFGDRVVVTYEDIPEHGSSNTNTFQIEMFFNGKIRISWLGVDSVDSIVGLSEGNGLPPDFAESDISAVLPCCRGDFNHDGQISLADLAVMLAHYPTASGAIYEEGDFDLDGDIDLSDLAALLAVYGTSCD